MKSAITARLIPIIRDLNPFGEFIAVVRIAIKNDEGSPTESHDYWLIPSPVEVTLQPKKITREEFLSLCENLFIRDNAAATAYWPPPV
jgi:hypothetical protein